MAQTRVAIELGLDIEGLAVTTSLLNGSVDPSAGAGVAANIGSSYQRSSGQLWLKVGALDTDWVMYADNTGAPSSAEDGYQNTFMGKTAGAGGNENPTYSSFGNFAQGSSLLAAIGALDANLGADSQLTPLTRTVGQLVAADSAKQNIELLDTVIGADSQITTPTYISTANSVYQNLNALDNELAAQDGRLDALETGQLWIEAVKAVTSDDLSAKSGLTPLTDDDGSVYTPVAGQRVASTVDNKIYTVVTPGAWTVAHTLAAGETFFADFNLIDPLNEEKGAAYTYNGAAMVKVADFDFESANSISLTGGYAQVNGTITSSDTVQGAIQKLDGNQIDLITLSGVAQGAVNLGTFTGDVIADNDTVKQALQDLETELGTDAQLTPVTRTVGPVSTSNTKNQNIDALDLAIGSNAQLPTTPNVVSTANSVNQNIAALDAAVQNGIQVVANGVGATPVVVDSVLVDAIGAVEWLITITDTANAKRNAWLVYATHDGSIDGATDAATADSSNQLRQNANGAITGQSAGTITVTLTGTGAAQAMNLVVSNASVTVQVRARRHVVLI